MPHPTVPRRSSTPRPRLLQVATPALALAAALAAAVALPAIAWSRPAPTQAEESAAFLKQKGAEPGVTTLPDGLEYQPIKSGDASGPHPAATDSVMVVYTGKLTDGATFDDSKGQIVTLPLGQVIKGWSEGLQLMRPGDVWNFFIPSALAYGDKGGGPIPPDAALQFRVELVAISNH